MMDTLGLILLHSVVLPVINVTQVQPCFLNQTAGPDMWQNCGMQTDWLKVALMPWVWITGGWFSVMFAFIFMLITWMKYQKAIYPILTGIFFLPITYALLPSGLAGYGMILMAAGIGIFIFYAILSRTNED